MAFLHDSGYDCDIAETRSFFFLIYLYTHVSFSHFTSVIANHEPKRLMPCVYTARSSSCKWIRKAKGSCYGGNERKHLSMNSYEHKSVRDTMDITPLKSVSMSFSIFGNEKKQKKRNSSPLKTFTVCVIHLVTFNHFARRHTWERRALTSPFFLRLLLENEEKKRYSYKHTFTREIHTWTLMRW